MKNAKIESITVKYTGDYVYGLPARYFTFTFTKLGSGTYRYIWTNMPEKFKAVLQPNQYAIRSKTLLADRDLVSIAADIYEAYNLELGQECVEP